MINAQQTGCDLLVVSPHTDDAEIGMGGTMRLLADQGRTVWALDLTRGELGTNATVDERWREAAAASEVLGLAGRVQLSLPDGFIDGGNRDQVGEVVALLRRLRPRWVVTAPAAERHPDHIATPRLVQKAVFMARLQGWQPAPGPMRCWSGGQEPGEPAARWVIEALFEVCPEGEDPSLLFDVSAVWAAKQSALACYASQFGLTEGRTPTAINDPAFLDAIDRRGRFWGRQGSVQYAEALRGAGAPLYADLPEARWCR